MILHISPTLLFHGPHLEEQNFTNQSGVHHFVTARLHEWMGKQNHTCLWSLPPS